MRHFFWVDLEMSGLDDITDKILEIAVVITDVELKPVETYHRIVYQPPQVLETMNDWCKKTHGESGLSALVPTGTPLETVDKEVLELIGRHFPANERVVLCGNSVNNDKRFIDRYMTETAKRLHYRLIDVSSFKEVFREKYGLSFQKANAHRAIDDVMESIRELAFYLGYVKT
jgi:oligoribonuclease